MWAISINLIGESVGRIVLLQCLVFCLSLSFVNSADADCRKIYNKNIRDLNASLIQENQSSKSFEFSDLLNSISGQADLMKEKKREEQTSALSELVSTLDLIEGAEQSTSLTNNSVLNFYQEVVKQKPDMNLSTLIAEIKKANEENRLCSNGKTGMGESQILSSILSDSLNISPATDLTNYVVSYSCATPNAHSLFGSAKFTRSLTSQLYRLKRPSDQEIITKSQNCQNLQNLKIVSIPPEGVYCSAICKKATAIVAENDYQILTKVLDLSHVRLSNEKDAIEKFHQDTFEEFTNICPGGENLVRRVTESAPNWNYGEFAGEYQLINSLKITPKNICTTY